MSVLKIDAQVQKLDEVLGFVDEQLEQAGASMKVQMQIDVAVEEIEQRIPLLLLPSSIREHHLIRLQKRIPIRDFLLKNVRLAGWAFLL